jgi:hypothetical protein
MQKLTDRKRSCGPYETAATIHDTGVPRPVAVQIEARFLHIWLKGRRGVELLTWDELYWYAARKSAEARRRDRAAKRTAAP